jgi:general L-amino acid transport system permease protein
MSTHADAAAPAKPVFWNDPAYRAIFFQAVALILVVGLFWYLGSNTLANLEKSGSATGFSFLRSTAGFSIIQTLIPYSETSSYFIAFVVSLLNTLLIAVVGIVFATVLGFILGVARLSQNWIISKLAAVYVETFRNIPLLLQIFFWYHAVLKPLPGPKESLVFSGSFFLNNRGLYLPGPIAGDTFWIVLAVLALGIAGTVMLFRWSKARQATTGEQFPVVRYGLLLIIGAPALAYVLVGQLFGSPLTFDMPQLGRFNLQGGIVIIPEFIAMLIALSVYTAAFIAEIVRAGIQSVSHGQTEASLALGMKRGPTMRLVIIPQAMRVIIPPLTSQYLNLTKNSSLATAIAYPDLTAVFAGTVLNQTGQAVEIIGITMAVYLSISLATAGFMNWYNARKALVER